MRRALPLRISIFLGVLALALPALAYEYPLSSYAIRQAYFLGAGPHSKEPEFYANYEHVLPMPRKTLPGSLVGIKTPYLQVAEYSRDTPNYNAQDAIKDFFGKPATFRAFIDVYFKPGSTPADPSDPLDGVRVKLIQNGKEIATESAEGWPLAFVRDENTRQESAGEHIEIACKAEKIDGSTLKIEVDTPDGEHAETEFDLARLR
ncbi:MAG TPA: hypothetical protein VLY23_04545 [Candidatus Acidoferrum sp.]|nr:hypothetical protein [Candidatus Acidoferrum sp.]